LITTCGISLNIYKYEEYKAMKAGRIILIIPVIIVLASILATGQSVPHLINYQGRLTNPSGQPLDGETVDLTFALYGVESGGTPLYLTVLQEDVLVTAGIYNVLIGSGAITPGTENNLADVFQKHSEVWMGVAVDSDPEMTPRSRITSVPYALAIDPTSLMNAVWSYPDRDADGYQSVLMGGSDCHDGDSAIHPGAIEIPCDDIDQDCDGQDLQGWQKIGSDILVTNIASTSSSPSLSWTGSEFGVSWRDYRDGNAEIYFVRLSSDGNTIGSDLRVTNDASYSEQPSLSWTGSEYGVCWYDERDGSREIYFARISSAGSKIGSDLRITNDASYSMDSSLTWTGSEFGVSWGSYSGANDEIHFARISNAGSTIGSELSVTSGENGSVYPSLSWTGTEFGVSWSDYRDGNREIYFARISEAGAKIGSDLRVTRTVGWGFTPSLSWSGSEFGVSWMDDREGNFEIYFALISADGNTTGSDFRITSATGDSSYPSLSWTGSEFGVSWMDCRDGNSAEIYFARVSAAGAKIGSDLRVTSATSDSSYPSLSWAGSEFGLSWEDRRGLFTQIYFARIGDVCP
jgi:hypothetical protein